MTAQRIEDTHYTKPHQITHHPPPTTHHPSPTSFSTLEMLWLSSHLRVRLQLDVHAALARVHAAQGQREDAQHHEAKARSIVASIETNLASSGLEAQLRSIG